MSSQFPALVMIIRHGEKPGNPADDTKGGPNLSILGSARAAALPSLFTPSPATTPVPGQKQLECKVEVDKTPSTAEFKCAYDASTADAGNPRFQAPNFLFATEGSANSGRPVETISAAAQALQLPIVSSPYGNKDYGKLVKDILGAPATYGGKVILICWHHGTIIDMAHAFGVSHSDLQPWTPWNATVFDLVFQITWDNSSKAHLLVRYQKLLYGDTQGQAAD